MRVGNDYNDICVVLSAMFWKYVVMKLVIKLVMRCLMATDIIY